jgi:membrane-bound lytic murein transglycosylase D
LAADAADVSLTAMKELNPALLHGIAPQFYELRVPKGSGPEVSEWIAKVPAEKRTIWRLHRAQESDTLDALARTYRTTAAEIAAKNELAPNAALAAEQILLMPSAPEPARTAYRWVWVRGRRVAVPVTAPAAKAPVVASAKAPAKAPARAVAPAKKPAVPAKPAPTMHSKRPVRT